MVSDLLFYFGQLLVVVGNFFVRKICINKIFVLILHSIFALICKGVGDEKL